MSRSHRGSNYAAVTRASRVETIRQRLGATVDVPRGSGLSSRVTRDVLAELLVRGETADPPMLVAVASTELGAELGYSKKAIIRAENWLIEQGHLERAAAGGGRAVTTWRVHVDRLPADVLAKKKRSKTSEPDPTADRHRPDDRGEWSGPWPFRGDTCYPPPGQNVVYALRATGGLAIYVGSTNDFARRLKAHAKAGKSWASWQATPCATREEAFALEAAALREYMPHLNIAGPSSRR
jgi:hypothetical protein